VSVVVNKFARVRHFDPKTGYSQCTLGESVLCTAVSQVLDAGGARPGYCDGVLLVSLLAEGFTCPVVELVEGDRLVGVYTARRAGEEPRKQVQVVRAGAEQAPAKSVEVVLYASTLLAEDGDNDLEAVEGNFEIVSINASVDEGGDEPMAPETLMANHFGESGGTDTQMSDKEFVEALRRSREFWRGRALLSTGRVARRREKRWD